MTDPSGNTEKSTANGDKGSGLGPRSRIADINASDQSITTAIRPSGKRRVALSENSAPAMAPTASPLRTTPIRSGEAPVCRARVLINR
ncbi:hypothetical protein ACFRDV_17320 [Streptomyces fagopyri]|uniref:hypothetical protein n=1 Tax=Streptomyces fagopyri TaxID=2662397 RepID=UPI00369FD82C